MAIVLFGLALIVYLDAAMLRRRDGRLFNDVFTVSPVLTTAIVGLVLFHLAIVESSPQTLPQFLFVALLPIYLLRRIRFLNSLEKNNPNLPRLYIFLFLESGRMV